MHDDDGGSDPGILERKTTDLEKRILFFYDNVSAISI